MTIIEVSDSAIQKLLEKKSQDNFEYIRIGITGGVVLDLNTSLTQYKKKKIQTC